MQTFIETRDGTPLFFKDWGGDGEPLVFLHSWGLDNDIWQYQHEHFARAQRRVVAFDRRGHGRSGQPARGYDIDSLADDLADVLSALAIKDAVLIGHSMGCTEIARYLARHGSERVERIALVAPTTPCLLQSPDNPAGIAAAVFDGLRDRWREDFPGWIVENARPFFVPETSAATLEWAVGMMRQTPVKIAIDCNRSVVDADVRADLRGVRVPALVVHGTADASAPYHLTGQATAALLPNCTFKTYEGAPHGLMITHRAQLNSDLDEFLQRSRPMTTGLGDKE